MLKIFQMKITYKSFINKDVLWQVYPNIYRKYEKINFNLTKGDEEIV
ncbi:MULTISPECIES: hypothetical protein [Bacillus]|nr:MULTISPECIES: hypothetical protein [Bacillus]MED1462950.1 hypothetical protein [Bacillus paramycoides]MED1492568.1 hypothetical protein [Bacillus paramycoides]